MEPRKFESGAIRDTSKGKISYLARNPMIEHSFAAYMTRHSVMPDGTKRSMQNWWKGFGLEQDMESLARHFADLEALHAGYAVYKVKDENGERTIIDPDGIAKLDLRYHVCTIEDTINAIRFNLGVYMLDYWKNQRNVACVDTKQIGVV